LVEDWRRLENRDTDGNGGGIANWHTDGDDMEQGGTWCAVRTDRYTAVQRTISNVVQRAARGRRVSWHTVGAVGRVAALDDVGTARRVVTRCAIKDAGRGATWHAVRTVERMVAQHTIGVYGHAAAQHAISGANRVDVDRLVNADWLVGIGRPVGWPWGNHWLEDRWLGNQQPKNL
jgi:hypothetical protein